MVKKWRKRLFYSLIILFILLGAGGVLYAQGWRLDIKSFTAKKVGAIYVRSFPKEAEIYLNGKPIKNKTGIFQAGTLINGLFPKTYKLKLFLPNYYDWQRTVAVQPSLVSEAKYAVLVPREPTAVFVEPLKNFWIINGEVLIQRNNNELVFRNQTLKGEEVIKLTQNPRSVLTIDSKNKEYIWNELENGTSTNLSVLFRKLTKRTLAPSTITIDPATGAKLIIFNPSSLSILDIKKESLLVISTSSAAITGISPSRLWIAWGTFDSRQNVSALNIYDKLSGNTKTISKTLSAKIIKLAWGGDNRLGLLQDNGEFYLYDSGADKPVPLASDAKDFVFADDGSKVAVLETKSLEVFSLKTEEYWRFNLSEMGAVKKISWFRDNHHLFIGYPARTIFLDLDDLSQENLITVAKTGDFDYDSKANRLYFLEDGKLLRLDFPS
jgi:hypothetical protein